MKYFKNATSVEVLVSGCIVLIVSSMLLLMGLKLVGGVDLVYSEGSRTGKVFKLAERGLYWKTWEGEMDLDLLHTNKNGLESKVWRFSARDPEVIDALQIASKNGSRVTLNYTQPLIMGWSDGDSGYMIHSVESPDWEVLPAPTFSELKKEFHGTK